MMEERVAGELAIRKKKRMLVPSAGERGKGEAVRWWLRGCDWEDTSMSSSNALFTSTLSASLGEFIAIEERKV